MTPTDEATWISDGTKDVEPVTVETPADEVSPQEAALSVEVLETTEPVSADPVEIEAVETKEVETVAVDGVAGTVEEIVQKFIDAKHGDEAFQIPEGLMVPQTRGGETEYVPIEEVLERGMKGKDYTLKTTELAEGRRSLERGTEDLSARETRMDVRKEQLDARDAELKAAMTNPESAAAYQEHLAQYQSNPIYRKNVDAALSQQETEAERDELQAREDKRVVREASEAVSGWIETLHTEYPGVDPARVRDTYSLQLKAGVAQLDQSAVRSIYEAEKDHADTAVSPLQAQLADIRAQLDSLQAGKAADQHNDNTQHAVKRAKTTPVSTGAGAPAKTTVAPTKFGPNELVERSQDWVNQGVA